MLSVRNFSDMDPEEFNNYLGKLQVYLRNTDATYKALQKYASKLYKEDDDRSRQIYRVVSKKMKLLLKDGYTGKKRIPNTGTKVEERRFYEDNAKNRKLNRVGKPYNYTYWKNAELRSIKHRIKRPKQSVKEDDDLRETKKPNMWIQSVKQARKELTDEGRELKFVTIRKEISDPDNEDQATGLLLYQRALAIYQKQKQLS